MSLLSLFATISRINQKCYFTLSTIATGALIFFLDYYLKEVFRKRFLQFQKNNNHDILKINKMLVFIGSDLPCDGHIDRNLRCQNMSCNYGKLRYLLDFIDNCKETLDICIYIISVNEIRDCIINAFNRGVRVRVITDAESSISGISCISSFRKLHIPVRQQMSNYIMHHKFVIVDGKILITGSMNFTLSGAFNNWESVLVTTQPSLLVSFSEGFESLWLEFAPNRIHSRFKANNENFQRH